MMGGAITFLVGLFFGACIGAFCTALCIAVSDDRNGE